MLTRAKAAERVEPELVLDRGAAAGMEEINDERADVPRGPLMRRDLSPRPVCLPSQPSCLSIQPLPIALFDRSTPAP
jgi:hypothetical protein